MRTVSFQGTQLSDAQRRQLAFQQQARAAFLNPALEQQVVQTLAKVDQYNDRENAKYRFDHDEHFTPWMGDVFGF